MSGSKEPGRGMGAVEPISKEEQQKGWLGRLKEYLLSGLLCYQKLAVKDEEQTTAVNSESLKASVVSWSIMILLLRFSPCTLQCKSQNGQISCRRQPRGNLNSLRAHRVK